jgi:protein tyrosine phosphatase
MYEDLDSRNHGLTYVVHCFGGVGRTGTFLMVCFSSLLALLL